MKKVGLISIVALVTLLTACENNTSNENYIQSTSVVSSSVGVSSNTEENVPVTSSLSSAETSSAEPPVIQEQQKKIPLAQEEYCNLMSSDRFYYTTNAVESGFDLTNSINNVYTLEYALSILPELGGKADDVKSDMPEDFVGDALSSTYLYKPETAENQIRNYLLPSFKIDSIDYKSSDLWDAKNGYIKACNYSSADELRGIVESAYKFGDYYYANMVLNEGYGGESYSGYLSSLNLNEQNLNIPLVQVKFKKITVKSVYGEHDRYIPIGFDPDDQRPEWMKKAQSLFESIDRDKLENLRNYPSSMQMGVGVMSGNLGKRMYIRYISQMGSHNFTSVNSILTIGARGTNDVILYEYSTNTATTNGGLVIDDTATPKEINTIKITIQDSFKGETYAYYKSSTRNPFGELLEELTIKYTLNEKEISEKEYNSAEVTAYLADAEQLFYDTGNKERIVFQCENSFENMTLTDFYEICRVITE